MILLVFFSMKNLKTPNTIQDLDLFFIEKFFLNNDLYFRSCVDEYKKFLTLKIMDFNNTVEPSEKALNIWKYHILHTQKYIEDCEVIFGRILFIDDKFLKADLKF